MPQTNVIEIHLVLLFTLYNTKYIAYHVTEVLIFYADKVMVMSNSKDSHVFNLEILLYISYVVPNVDALIIWSVRRQMMRNVLCCTLCTLVIHYNIYTCA